MKGLFKGLANKIERLNRITYLISSLAIVLAAFVLTYEVIMRYVLRTPTIWEIEASVYLTIMATFVAAAYGLKDGAHLSIDLITRLLSREANARLSIVTSILSLIFIMLLAWKGWEMWWEAFSKGWRSESIWSFPLAVPYFFLPFGMTLLSLQYIIQIGKFQGPEGQKKN